MPIPILSFRKFMELQRTDYVDNIGLQLGLPNSAVRKAVEITPQVIPDFRVGDSKVNLSILRVDKVGSDGTAHIRVEDQPFQVKVVKKGQHWVVDPDNHIGPLAKIVSADELGRLMNPQLRTGSPAPQAAPGGPGGAPPMGGPQ